MEIKNIDIKIKEEREENQKDINEFTEKLNSVSKGIEKETNSFNFQMFLKVNFDKKKIFAIKEISKNRIGILFNDNTFEIYNSNNFSKIKEIKVNVIPFKNEEEKGYRNLVFNFLELQNFYLVFWTIETIYFYRLLGEEYIQHHTITESTQEEGNNHRKFRMDRYDYNNKDVYKINSICELKNGNLVSCNSYGIKIYTKENDNYKLLSQQSLDVEVRNAIEIKSNKLILMQQNFESGGFCSQTYYCILTYSLSMYDVENNKIINLDSFKENVSLRDNAISFFNNDKYLFVKFGGFKFGIYDINENMKSIIVFKRN